MENIDNVSEPEVSNDIVDNSSRSSTWNLNPNVDIISIPFHKHMLQREDSIIGKPNEANNVLLTTNEDIISFNYWTL